MGATSQKAIEIKRKGKKVFLYILITIIVILLGFTSYIYWIRFQKIFDQREELNQLLQKRARIVRENRELEEKLAKKNDLDYIARLANQELGFVFPEKEEKNEETD